MLQRYEVGAAVAGPLPGESPAYRAWIEEIEDRNVLVMLAQSGQQLDLGGGARIEVLAPLAQMLSETADDLNNNSVVLRLVYDDFSFLLTGDLATDGESALLDAPVDLRATVLKVGHHGSDGSTTPRFSMQ